MRKDVILLLLSVFILTGCEFAPIPNQSDHSIDEEIGQEVVQEMFVLIKKQSFDNNGKAADPCYLYEYNAQGLLCKDSIYSNEEHKTTVSTSYFYYDNGKIKKTETKRWFGGSFKTRGIVYYDENGIKTGSWGSTGKHDTTKKYQNIFDDQDRLIKTSCSADGISEEYLYEYSANGKLLVETYNYSGITHKRTVTNYGYSEDGTLISKDEVSEIIDGRKTSETHYTTKYKWSNDKLSCTEYCYIDNNLEAQYERTYDSFGNLLLEKETISGIIKKECTYDLDGKLLTEKTPNGYTEYTYEWLPDHYKRIKESKKTNTSRTR